MPTLYQLIFSTTTLTDLPSDLLLEIFGYLPEKIDPPQSNTEYGGLQLRAGDWLNQEHPPLKTLRLVNKRFHALFTPLLFDSLLLMRHPDSWWNLNLVAMSWLAPFVKVIKVSVLMDLPVYDNIQQWEKENPYVRRDSPPLPAYLPYRNIVSSRKEILYTNPTAGGPLTKLDLSSRDKAYQRYQYWANGEKAMRAHYEKNTTPVLLLGLLYNLQRLETAGLDTLANVKVKLTAPGHFDQKDQQLYWNSVTHANKRAIEASSIDTYGE